MTNERKQVLELLAQGKITAEDAERLLDKLAPSAQTDQGAVRPEGPASRDPKFMRVSVDSHEGDKVDIRLPIGLLRSGIKLSAMMPKEAAQAMSKNGFDFAHLRDLSGSDLMEAMREISIDVVSNEGDKVKISCE